MAKFVQILFEMTTEDANRDAIRFSNDGLHLELYSLEAFTKLLPIYYKHNKFPSFVRQLNNYGFRSLPPKAKSTCTHCFFHPLFQRNKKHLLDNIRLRSSDNVLLLEQQESTTPGSSPKQPQQQQQLRADFNHDLQLENEALKKRIRFLEEELEAKCQQLMLAKNSDSSPQFLDQRRVSATQVLQFLGTQNNCSPPLGNLHDFDDIDFSS